MVLDITKTDKELGESVNAYLRKLGKNTPTIKGKFFATEDRIKFIEESFTDIMNDLNLDLKDDSLKETPKRIAKMFVNELFWGLEDKNFPKITTVENKMNYDEMILIKNINVSSTCEHHFVTFQGVAHIAYIPNKKIIGLSKFNRIVDYFSRRPQIQERLTEQIYYALSYILDTEDIAIVMNATHFCVKTRGVQDQTSNTTTSKLGGQFKKNASARQEFLELIK